MKKRKRLASIFVGDKPWAKLRVSRKQYLANKPWKKAGLSRQDFEQTLRLAPDDIIDELWDEAHADMLLKSMGLSE